ncbi:hypothetical protein BH23GEM6_BH23GEM6_08270 [soil metagenome]
MSFHIVKHLCGHEAQYRMTGGRTVVSHHIHELQQSPCTPCAEKGADGRRHIYLGRGTKIVALPERQFSPVIMPSIYREGSEPEPTSS